jgi:phage anti-repressor protein
VSGNTYYPALSEVGVRKRTQGTETSKYLQVTEINRDSLSSGERTGYSLNLDHAKRVGVVD